MKFAMLSDTHYASRRLIADKTDTELMLQPAVSEKAVLDAAEKTDTIFIIGDLADIGDRWSHEDFAEFLRSVKAKGKKIYVLFATHDFHHHKAYVRALGEKVQYKESPWDQPYFNKDGFDWKSIVCDEFKDLSEEECTPTLVEALAPEEIWEMYREFGVDGAYSVHEASYSYCVDLDDETRCLMLNDSFRNEEALRDKSATYGPSCLRWIKKMVDEAARDGKFIFACSHHPMLPATPAHRIGAGKENRDMRSPVVGQTLADIGIQLMFTGHSHFCDVGYVRSRKGNQLFSVTVPSVRFYPPAYRMVDLDGKKHTVHYDCTVIDTPEGFTLPEATLAEHYRLDYYRDYASKLTGNETVKKLITTKKIKDLLFLVKNTAKLTPDEVASIKDMTILDFLLDVGFNMITGDGAYTPDTPEYKIMMALCAKLDSIIDTLPVIDIKKKFLCGYSMSETIEPMLFNNYTPDREATVDFTKPPRKVRETPVYTSHAGDVLMAVIYGIALLLSPSATAVTAIGIPVLVMQKKKKNRTNPTRPDMYY